MRLGLSLPVFTDDARRPLEAAQRAVQAGYDGAFAPDHLFPPGAPDRPSLDAFSVLSAVAAANPGLTVGPLVSRAGVRPAGLLAKQAAALEQIGGAGAVLGLGIGDRHAEAEHEAYGLPFPPPDERRIVLEETAQACRSLFKGLPWPGGRRVGPIAGPLVPPGQADIWFGGKSERVLKAAARSADAWNGWGLHDDAFLERTARLAELTRACGRDPGAVPPTWGGIVLVGQDAAELASLETDRRRRGLPMEIWRGTVEDLRRLMERLRSAGTAWFLAVPAGPPDRTELIARTLDDARSAA
jgi:alkanesulfonate monooxygenase SsuD/methylene tetrahydromethanopterin reductase-like flavin-dependent oxidoreductase (luciferase family)